MDERAGQGFRRIFPSFASEQERYTYYGRMRLEQPVHVDEESGVWRVFRYDDVRRVLTEHAAFSSEAAFARPEPPRQPELDPRAAHGAREAARERPGGFLSQTVLTTDPPVHTKLRGLVTRAFTPKAIGRLEPLIRDLAAKRLDPAIGNGAVDIMQELAGPLPITVIATLLGLPTQDIPRFRAWADTFNTSQDPATGTPDPAAFQERLRKMQDELDDYFTPLIEAKRRHPAHDVISDLAHAEVDGKRLGPDELRAFCELLLLAGFITTTHLIGNGIWLLSEHPEAFAALRSDAARVPAAVEEILRFCSPVQAMARRTVRPIELGGRTIPPGARVIAWIGSANRDAAVFPDGDRFQPERAPNPHLAFGHGIHFCLGAPLARLEGRVVFEELARRVGGLEMAPAASLEFSPGFIHGLRRLPVHLRAPAGRR